MTMISDIVCTENGIHGWREGEMGVGPEGDQPAGRCPWWCRHCARASGEDGFTLIELLIVLILLPAIVGAVTIAIITTLKNQDSASNRLANSVDAQITSATFTRDVQSALTVTTGSPASPAQCDPNLQGGILLGLQWTNAVVTYADIKIGSGSSAHYDLVRRFCGGTTSVETIAHNLQLPGTLPGTQGTATVTCGPTITGANCNYATAWMSTAGVSGVSLTVVDLPPNPNAASPSKYNFTLSATPRNWNNGSLSVVGGGTPLPPMFLTGSGLPPNSCVVTMTASGDSVTVQNGPLLLSSGDKICNGNSGVTLNVNPGPILSYQCGGSCGQALSSFTGTCTENGGSCSVQSTNTLASLPVIPAPSTPKTTDPPKTCVMAANVTCQPGYYPNGLTIPSGDIVTFAPGNYLFGNQLQILGNVTFGSGDYTFNNGLLFNHDGVVMQGNGVFFYMAGGAFAVDTQNNTINLVAPATGPYAGLLYYQPTTNTSQLSLGAKGTSTVAYGGAVEAPSANVVMGSTGDIFSVGELVAASLTLGSKSASATAG
jgi:type II secretory pathway pseudopilin PulG